LIIAVFALAKLFVHLATAGSSGYFRDELYYLACTEHLGAGYVDHPALSILVLWVVRRLFGSSLFALRLVPAVAGAVLVALVGLIARRLGGGRLAQALAMTATLIAGQYLSLGHFYSMNALDLVVWALASYLVVALLDGGAPWLWLALGTVLGLGLENKLSVPYLGWQLANGWPTREFIHNATNEKMVQVDLLGFLHGQIDTMNPFNLPLWVAGLVALLVHPRLRRFRLLAWVYLAVFTILVVNGHSRAGYLSGTYSWLFAAGGCAVEGLLMRRRPLGWVVVVLLLALGVLLAPFAMPILPVDRYVRYAAAWGVAPSTEERKELGRLPQFQADFQGWPVIASTLATAYLALPAEERAGARIFAPDYGVAGALDFFASPRGVPPALSGHNSYWLWGYDGYAGGTLVLDGGNQERWSARCGELRQVATIECGDCLPYENHRPVWLCRGLRLPVEDLWREIKHYD
jgi:hypothetical protein